MGRSPSRLSGRHLGAQDPGAVIRQIKDTLASAVKDLAQDGDRLPPAIEGDAVPKIAG